LGAVSGITGAIIMNKNVITIIVAAIIVLALGIVIFVQNGKLNEESKRLQETQRMVVDRDSQIKDLNNTVAAGQRQLETERVAAAQIRGQLEAQLAEVTAAKKSVEDKLAETTEKLNDANDQIASKNRAMEQLEQTREELQTKLDELQTRMTALRQHSDLLQKQLHNETDQRGRVEQELAKLRSEYDALMAQWSSLKKIQERLVEIREEQRAADKRRAEEQKIAIQMRKREIGNRGYLVRDGKSTFNPEAWRLFQRDRQPPAGSLPTFR
jgi:chromosome segregation ATPase